MFDMLAGFSFEASCHWNLTFKWYSTADYFLLIKNKSTFCIRSTVTDLHGDKSTLLFLFNNTRRNCKSKFALSSSQQQLGGESVKTVNNGIIERCTN